MKNILFIYLRFLVSFIWYNPIWEKIMKYIKKLTDEDFDLKVKEFNNPRYRRGARGVILNGKNEIAILNKANKNEYKLIGGGIEENEEPTKAFKREALEESGCKVEIDDFLGIIREEKSQDNFIQDSNVYLAHVIEDTNKLDLTAKEKEEGARLVWLNLDDAMKLIKDSEKNIVASKYENVYHTKFIVRRDYAILKYYKRYYL